MLGQMFFHHWKSFTELFWSRNMDTRKCCFILEPAARSNSCEFEIDQVVNYLRSKSKRQALTLGCQLPRLVFLLQVTQRMRAGTVYKATIFSSVCLWYTLPTLHGLCLLKCNIAQPIMNIAIVMDMQIDHTIERMSFAQNCTQYSIKDTSTLHTFSHQCRFTDEIQ